MKPSVKTFFDEPTFTATHVVGDPETKVAAVVNSVLDYDHKAGRTGTGSADAVIAFVREQGLTVDWILETHAHADHLTAAPYLQETLGGKIAHRRRTSPSCRRPSARCSTRGRLRDRRLAVRPPVRRRRDASCIGEIDGHVHAHAGPHAGLHDLCRSATPPSSATPCSCPTTAPRAATSPAATRRRCTARSRRSSRCRRRPGCSCATTTRRRAATPIAWETTVAEEKAKNVHVHDGVGEAEFVEMRTERDATLAMPRADPAVGAGQHARRPPAAAPRTTAFSYLKLPVNAL